MNDPNFVYLSSKAGSIVTRYGVASFGQHYWIGAKLADQNDPTSIVWDESHIEAIPKAEFERYRREYQRLINSGELVLHH